MEENFNKLLRAILREEIEAVSDLVPCVDNLNLHDEFGTTLLINCLQDNFMAGTKLLLENGADPNLKSTNKKGFAPLHTAAAKHNLVAVKLLIKYGAEIDIQDAFGNTPLLEAIFKYETDMKTIDFLIEKGANPDLKNYSDVSPRDLAKDFGVPI